VIRTDGGDRLENTSSSLFRNIGTATWVAVAKYPAATGPGNAGLLMCSRGDAANSTRFVLTSNPNPGGAFMGVAGRRLDSDSYTTATSSTARIVGTWFIEVGQLDYANAEANHWTDGAQDLTGASFLSAGNSDDTDPLNINVFATSNIPAPADTEIAEAIAIEGPLSTEDRQKLEGYLAHKWDLQANLPANHPYKAAPPVLPPTGPKETDLFIRGTASSQDGSEGAFTWRDLNNNVITPTSGDVIIIKSIFMEQSNHSVPVRIFQDFNEDGDYDSGEDIWRFKSSSSADRCASHININFPVSGAYPLYFQIDDGGGVEQASVLVHADLQRREAYT